MKMKFAWLVVAILFASSSAYAFIGQSRDYAVESDFGITGSCTMVVFPKSFRLEAEGATFYVPFTSIDYTLLENTTITVSMRGKIITLKVRSKALAMKLNEDLTRAITGDFL